MNPAAFLQRCDRIITGYGFKRSIPVSLGECRCPELYVAYLKAEDPGVNAEYTGIDMLDTGGLGMVLWADEGQQDITQFNLVVPQDYDESVDKLRIRALCSMNGGTTDTVYLDAKVYLKRAGAALTADLDPTIDATRIPAAIASASWREVNCDGEGLQGGDCLTVVLTTAAHTTDGIMIYGIEVVYAGCLAYFDQADRPLE